MTTSRFVSTKKQSLDEIVRRLLAGEVELSELSTATLQQLANPEMAKYTDEELQQIVLTCKLPE